MNSSDSDEWDEWLMENITNKYKKSKRRYWMHTLYQSREEGEYRKTSLKLRNYPEKFREYYRMDIATYDYILRAISEDIKRYSNFRRCIEPGEKLTICLRYFATGLSFRSLAFSFRVDHYTIGKLVEELCDALWNKLSATHLAVPNQDGFRKISSKFNARWNFPNCVGCIDGKHIEIKCPPKSGTMYYNYKHFYSIVLQGVADADCRFIFIDVGSYGRQSDGGTFAISNLYDFLENYNNTLPPPAPIHGIPDDMPFVLLGDDAYPLKTYLMKPYSKRQLTNQERIFNYRLSRARRCIECTFGILCAKWRLLNKAIETDVEKAIKIVKTICLLHNMVMDFEGSPNIAIARQALEIYRNQNNVINNARRIGRTFNNNSNDAKQIREDLNRYFNGPIGSVSFQTNCLNI
ncbi:uncharacterized protein [Onthophagus taurus]|uniref:uncharacterized protein n=1 Tax=Onthophagus taurus TaxID=166361 RepID=UPI0039BE50E7